MRFIRIVILLLISHTVKGSTFFMPDSDTAALVMLVSNTASTVSNTMKILNVAKNTYKKIDEYNFIAMRRYFIARRIEQHARDLIEAKKMKPKGLQEVNQVLMRLKINLRGLRSNIDFMAEDVLKAQNLTDRVFDKIANSVEDIGEAHNQENLSASEGTTSKHVQNTAINTALNSKILAKIRRDNIEYQHIDIGLQKSQAISTLRSEEHYRGWIGVGKKKLEKSEVKGE